MTISRGLARVALLLVMSSTLLCADLAFAESKRVALRAHNGMFVAAEGGGGSGLIANRPRAGGWETFTLVALGGSKVALRAVNGQYVCADQRKGQKLEANRSRIDDWETFTIIPVAEEGRIALKAHNGRYVTAELAGDKRLYANRSQIRDWEIFTLMSMPSREILEVCVVPPNLTETQSNGLAGDWIVGGSYATVIQGEHATIEQDGDVLTFTNEYGESSKGRFVDPGTVEAIDWGGMKGRIIQNGTRLEWANDSFWTKVRSGGSGQSAGAEGESPTLDAVLCAPPMPRAETPEPVRR